MAPRAKERSLLLQGLNHLITRWERDLNSEGTMKASLVSLFYNQFFVELKLESGRFKEIIFKSKRREKINVSVRQNLNRSNLL